MLVCDKCRQEVERSQGLSLYLEYASTNDGRHGARSKMFQGDMCDDCRSKFVVVLADAVDQFFVGESKAAHKPARLIRTDPEIPF